MLGIGRFVNGVDRAAETLRRPNLARVLVGGLGAIGDASARYRKLPITRYELINVPIDELVYADLRGRAVEQETTISRLAADLLTVVTGYRKLVSDLPPAERCPLPQLRRAINRPNVRWRTGTRIVTQLWVPRAVYRVICSVKPGCDTALVAADLLAVATGRPELIRHLDRADILQLLSVSGCPVVDGGGGLAATCRSCPNRCAFKATAGGSLAAVGLRSTPANVALGRQLCPACG